jgi:hypothetical protein
MRALCFCIAALLSLSANAQWIWTDVDTLFQPLPKSIKVRQGKGLIEGKPVIAYCIQATLSDAHLQFTTQVGHGKRFTPAQYFEKEGKPLVVVNGTFFSFADNRNLNVVIKEGKLEAYNVSAIRKQKDSAFYYPTRSALGIDDRRRADVAWLYTDSASRYAYAMRRGPSAAEGSSPNPSWKDIKKGVPGVFFKKKKWRMKTAIGGGPVLVQKRKMAMTHKAERLFVNGEADRHPRTAMGYTRSGQLIILVVAGRHPGISEGVTLRQEAELLLQLGCYEALNLDGGGSSCLLINGKETIRPSDKEGQRPVPAVFMIQSAIR